MAVSSSPSFVSAVGATPSVQTPAIALVFAPSLALAAFHPTWSAVPVLIVGALTAGLGVGVAVRERGSGVSLAFAFVTLSAALWLLGLAGAYSSATDADALGWIRFEHIGVVLIPTAVLVFALAITGRVRSLLYVGCGGLALSALLFVGVASTDRFVTGARLYTWGYYPQYGPLSIPYLGSFLVSVAASLYLYWSHYRQSRPGSRQSLRLRAFLVAFAVGYLGAIDFLPAYGVPVYPFGYAPVFLFLALTARAIRRYHLVDITPAFAAERILAIMPDALLIADSEGLIRVANQAACRTLGKTETELVGAPLAPILKPPMQPQALQRDGQILYEVELPTLSSESRTLSVAAALVRDESGEAVATIYLGRDITHLKQTEERIRQLNFELERRVLERTHELEAANRDLEAFTYSVSHDLRAPLRAIQGFSQILLSDHATSLDVSGLDLLKRIGAATLRMSQLIDDLLRLSRVGRGELRRETVSLTTLAEDIVSALRRRDPERAVDVVVSPGLIARADPSLIHIALENLLENAWKFTSKRPHARIEVGMLRHGDEEVFFVRDDGVGFDPAYAERLFQPFGRLHDASEFPGTGIGLATVQRIISKHGGSIWAEGKVDEGATFFFCL